jgi:hypothetical protein
LLLRRLYHKSYTRKVRFELHRLVTSINKENETKKKNRNKETEQGKDKNIDERERRVETGSRRNRKRRA